MLSAVESNAVHILKYCTSAPQFEVLILYLSTLGLAFTAVSILFTVQIKILTFSKYGIFRLISYECK